MKECNEWSEALIYKSEDLQIWFNWFQMQMFGAYLSSGSWNGDMTVTTIPSSSSIPVGFFIKPGSDGEYPSSMYTHRSLVEIFTW